MVWLVERQPQFHYFRSRLHHTWVFLDYVGDVPPARFKSSGIAYLWSASVLGHILIDGRRLLQLSWILPMCPRSEVTAEGNAYRQSVRQSFAKVLSFIIKGWDQAFRAMAKRADNTMLEGDVLVETSWEKEE